jgi:hypothetical protein
MQKDFGFWTHFIENTWHGKNYPLNNQLLQSKLNRKFFQACQINKASWPTAFFPCTFFRCNELNKEHGVHLIRPHVQKAHSSPSVLKLAPDQEPVIYRKRHDHLKKILNRPTDNASLNSGVKGFKFFVPEEADTQSWQVAKTCHEIPTASRVKYHYLDG